MPGGRPTIYDKDIVSTTQWYVDKGWEELGDAIPSIAGLSDHLGIPRQTIYDWASQEEKKEFSDILQRILSKQERTLLNKGLKNEFNSNIAKLALGKHGYSDKTELTGKDGKNLIPTIQDRELAERALENI